MTGTRADLLTKARRHAHALSHTHPEHGATVRLIHEMCNALHEDGRALDVMLDIATDNGACRMRRRHPCARPGISD